MILNDTVNVLDLKQLVILHILKPICEFYALKMQNDNFHSKIQSEVTSMIR